MVNMGPLTAEIGPVVWGTPANFNGGATYARQSDHHVGRWPTFLVVYVFLSVKNQKALTRGRTDHFNNIFSCDHEPGSLTLKFERDLENAEHTKCQGHKLCHSKVIVRKKRSGY